MHFFFLPLPELCTRLVTKAPVHSLHKNGILHPTRKCYRYIFITFTDWCLVSFFDVRPNLRHFCTERVSGIQKNKKQKNKTPLIQRPLVPPPDLTNRSPGIEVAACVYPSVSRFNWAGCFSAKAPFSLLCLYPDRVFTQVMFFFFFFSDREWGSCPLWFLVTFSSPCIKFQIRVALGNIAHDCLVRSQSHPSTTSSTRNARTRFFFQL